MRPLSIFVFLLIPVFFAFSFATQPFTSSKAGVELMIPEGQRMLTEPEWLSLNNSAVAGTVSSNGSFVSLLVLEDYPGMSLNQYVELLLQDLPATDAEILYFDEVTTPENRIAIEYGFKGMVEDRAVQYHLQVFLVGTIFYQRVGYHYIKDLNSTVSDLRTYLPPLTVLAGVTPELSNSWQRPSFGTTWYSDESNFYQVAFGFRMSLGNKALSVVPEDLLSEFHPSALAAFSIQGQEEVVYVLGFLSAISEADALASFQWPLGLDSMESNGIVYKTRFMTNGSVSLLFVEQGKKRDSKLDYHLARHFAWLQAEELDLAKRALHHPSRRVLLLDLEQSYYANTYRNSRFGLSLSLPSSDITEARLLPSASEDSFSVELHNHSKRYSMIIDLEEDQMVTATEYHAQSLELFAFSAKSNPVQTGAFLLSEGTIPPRTSPSCLLTRTWDSSFLRIVLHQKDGCDVSEVLKGLSLSKLKDIEKADSLLTDHRLGYRLKLAQVAKNSRVITSANLKPIGEMIQLELPKTKAFLMAVNAPLLNSQLALQLFLEEQDSNLHPELISSAPFQSLGLSGEEHHYRVLFSGNEQRLLQQTLHRGTLLLSIFSLLPLKEAPGKSDYFVLLGVDPDPGSIQ